MEVLKQDQYNPLSVEKQVLIICAASYGFLDKYPVNKIREYESKLFDFLDRNYSSLVKKLIEKRELSEDIKTEIREAFTAFDKTMMESWFAKFKNC